MKPLTLLWCLQVLWWILRLCYRVLHVVYVFGSETMPAKISDWQLQHKTNHCHLTSWSGCDYLVVQVLIISWLDLSQHPNCWHLQAIRSLRLDPGSIQQPYTSNSSSSHMSAPCLCCLPLAAHNKLKTSLLPYTGSPQHRDVWLQLNDASAELHFNT